MKQFALAALGAFMPVVVVWAVWRWATTRCAHPRLMYALDTEGAMTYKCARCGRLGPHAWIRKEA